MQGQGIWLPGISGLWTVIWTKELSVTVGLLLSDLSALSSLAGLQTNKHKQSLTADMVIRISSPGLGYVLLHHHPIRGLGSHRTWWCIKYHSMSSQSFWMQPFRTFNRPRWWCDIAFDPVEMCWQSTVSCKHQSYATARARMRDDISIHQCDGSRTENRLYMVSDPLRAAARLDSVSCALSPL